MIIVYLLSDTLVFSIFLLLIGAQVHSTVQKQLQHSETCVVSALRIFYNTVIYIGYILQITNIFDIFDIFKNLTIFSKIVTVLCQFLTFLVHWVSQKSMPYIFFHFPSTLAQRLV